MSVPFRFLHAADLHLERPPHQLAELPDHLRSAAIDAPLRAAERLFDTAIKEHVDFILLAGDVIDPATAGPRGLAFLTEHFARLAEREISVYWAGGPADHFERWLDAWPLPASVVRFPLHCTQRVVHQRGDTPLAQIVGASSEQLRRVPVEEFHADPQLPFAIGVAYGAADVDALGHSPIRYWALGGEHDRRTLLSGPVTAHYAGTTQGRTPDEGGPRGATLVHVDEVGHVRTSFVATDAVRFHHERVVLDETSPPERLREILTQRAADLLADPFGPDLFIRWTLVVDASQNIRAACEKQLVQLTSLLQAEFGQRRPAAWTTAVELSGAPPIGEALYDEESVLGEFLRTVRHYEDHPEAPLSLNALLGERHLAGALATEAAVEPASRRKLLAEVARLGHALLSPPGDARS